MAYVVTRWYANFGDGSTTGYYAVGAWVANTAKTVGLRIRQTAPAVDSERVFVCGVAGTTHATTEPTWVTTVGAKSPAAGQDGTVTWYECTGHPAMNGDVTNTPASSTTRSLNPAIGAIIKNNGATHYFICTTAGSCGAGEPSYSTTTGATTADSSCTWTCLGAVGSFTAWMAPIARLKLMASRGGNIGNDHLYVSSIHAETTSANPTWAFGSTSAGPVNIICIANGGTIPPTSADVTTGAKVTGTNASFNVNTSVNFVGVELVKNSAGAMTIGNTTPGGVIRFTNGALTLSNSSASLTFGSAGTGARIELINTPMNFSGVSNGVSWLSGHFTWRDTPAAVTNSGSWPSGLFSIDRSCVVHFEGLDLSNNTAIPFAAAGGRAVLSRCVMNSGVAVIGGGSNPGSTIVDMINCASGAVILNHERRTNEGTQVIETATIVHTGGATDGTTPYAWKLTTDASATRWDNPLDAMAMAVWNPTTASDVVVTVQGIFSSASLPNNDDIWLAVSYLGTASTTQGARINGTKSNVLAANAALPASTEAWDSLATARQNTHAYSLLDVIKLASNPGRLFICTTAGTSSGSEPVGYASAVDGGSVTDNTAIFRAMMRFKLTVTLTGPQPRSAAPLSCYVRVGKAGVATIYYVDPKPVLS